MQQNSQMKKYEAAAAVSQEGEYAEKYMQLNEVNRKKVLLLVEALKGGKKVS